MANDRTLPESPPELLFMLSCTKYTVGEEEKIRSILSPTIDWDLFLSLSMTHGLFPLVYNTLNRLDSPIIPKYVMNTLQKNCINNALKVIRMTDEITRIIKNMNESGIQSLILKGTPLSFKINEDIALRPSKDIDILVDPQDFFKAEKILEQIGYKRFSPNFTLTINQQKAFFKRYHHFEYFHSSRSILVELHWRIRSFDVKHFSTISQLNTQTIYIAEYPVTVMDNEHWLMFLMVHGYKHMWRRLRWLYDIKEFMKMNIDWDKMIFQADISGLRPIMHQTLILANILFDVRIPDCLEQSVANDYKAWQLTYTVIDKIYFNMNDVKLSKPEFKPLTKDAVKHFYYFNIGSKRKNKILFLFSLIKPSELDFKLISLPYQFYYFIKPIYWIWRRVIYSKRDN